MTAGDLAQRGSAREVGFVAAWFVVLLMVLLGICALAVDIVHAYQIKERAQSAADAAALGGTVFLPANPTEAVDRALHLATNNGFRNGSEGVTVTAVQLANPTQLEVTVTKEVQTWFARAIGFSSMTVHADATADYDQPVAMGSPANTFGNQPDCRAPCTNVRGAEAPQLWFNLAGPGSRKIAGDAILSTLCSTEEVGGTEIIPDNCATGNADHDAAGYSYAIRNVGDGGSLEVEVFDPAFVNVGDNCGDDDGGSRLKVLHDNLVAAGYSDAARYAPNEPNAESEWCTGDVYYPGDAPSPGGDPPVPVTSYGVYFDPGTPWSSDDDVAQQGCGRTFAGFEGDLNARFLTESADHSLEPTVTEYFRKWVSVCTITSAQRGDYVLRMWTNEGSGHNRGSIRVRKDGTLSSPDVSLAARGRMSIYANASGADTVFYLARVLPGAAGRSLAVRFFDTGDATLPGTVTILPPVDATAEGRGALASFSGCTYTPPPGSSHGPPWGAAVATAGGCSVSDVAYDPWNGQWVEWFVPIPSGYDCAYGSATGCWVRIRFQYQSGATVSDTTTWTASIDGNPVRLVE